LGESFIQVQHNFDKVAGPVLSDGLVGHYQHYGSEAVADIDGSFHAVVSADFEGGASGVIEAGVVG